MEIRFRETFALPVDEVFSYFETPRDWVRLYGLAADVRELGDGWVAVPLAAFPFPLVAKNERVEPNRLVRWRFRGFWKGEGEVRFRATDGGVALEGFETLSMRWLGPLSALLERLFLERRFRAVWSLGWRRLRKAEKQRAALPAAQPA